MKYILISLLLSVFLISVNCSKKNDSEKRATQSSAVDSTLSKVFCLYDTTFATAHFRISGESWDSTITVSISIIYNGNQIFYRILSDIFPAESEYSKDYYSDYPHSDNYIAFKKYYHLNLINDLIISNKKWQYISLADSDLVTSVLRPQYEKMDTVIQQNGLDGAVNKFRSHLLNKYYDMLRIPYGPLKDAYIYAYDPEVEQFINIDTE